MKTNFLDGQYPMVVMLTETMERLYCRIISLLGRESVPFRLEARSKSFFIHTCGSTNFFLVSQCECWRHKKRYLLWCSCRFIRCRFIPEWWWTCYIYLGSPGLYNVTFDQFGTGYNTQYAGFLSVGGTNTEFGKSVSGAGDINGDVGTEILVGAPRYNPDGLVSAYKGIPQISNNSNYAVFRLFAYIQGNYIRGGIQRGAELKACLFDSDCKFVDSDV